MDLKEIGRVDPYTHWYYQTKKTPLLRYFESQVVRKNTRVDVVDVGAGSGFFSFELQKEYSDFLDRLLLVDTGYTDEEIKETQHGIVQKRKEFPDDIGNSFIILMDVLEHIERDVEFLSHVRERVAGKNHFFVTVPAFMSLWSAHDVFLGHYRRYTLKTLSAILNSNGFKTTNVYYLYASIFPLAWLVRKFNANKQNHSDLKPAPPLVNVCLKQIISLEMSFRKLNRFFGVSCVAEGIVSE